MTRPADNSESMRELSVEEIDSVSGAFTWQALGASMVGGGITGGLGGAAIGGIGAVPGAIGGALLGGIGYIAVDFIDGL
jgi:hypothetical protein